MAALHKRGRENADSIYCRPCLWCGSRGWFSLQHPASRRATGLSGYVRNSNDGSVQVIACGEHQAVEQLVEWLKQGGPRSASVEKVFTEPHGKFDYKGFSIRY